MAKRRTAGTRLDTPARTSPPIGTFLHLLLNEVMDDLLKQADQLIRGCAITRERARHGLDQARANAEGARLLYALCATRWKVHAA
ncbi:hypothetical protein SAMN05216337_1006160 [Bradyrhizobium brasilense]|uniref:Uncharacterized protein n=1 Tax=Bradyrhizobium brasilense TaxID=1419277 RepID=A0A1G6QXU0_9BRAD|nr:hypothetical protein SAMN05216337_1006160 [Bradyrhizobium brasilense]